MTFSFHSSLKCFDIFIKMLKFIIGNFYATHTFLSAKTATMTFTYTPVVHEKDNAACKEYRMLGRFRFLQPNVSSSS